MSVRYDKLFALMTEKNISNGQLQKQAGFSANIITQLKRNQYISLESIALQVGLSPNYLGNLFFQQTGERFRDALIRLRMERAKELLLHSPLKIYEIAEQVGIHNPQYFTYLYQKTYGISPAKMRRSTQ